MAINTLMTNSSPMPNFGICVQSSGIAVNIDKEIYAEPNLCSCLRREDFFEYVTVSDVRSFIYNYVVPSDTIVFELVTENGKFVIDSTLGEIKDFSPQKTKGIYLDFQKVYDLHGFGEFTVLITKNITGIERIIESHNFQLIEQNEELFKNYVKLEFMQNADIKGVFNFANLNWYQAIRLEGGISSPTLELNTKGVVMDERYGRSVRKGASTIGNSQILEIKRVPVSIYNFLVNEGVLADSLLVTGWVSKSFQKYNKESFYVSEIKDPKIYDYDLFCDIELVIKKERDVIIRKRY